MQDVWRSGFGSSPLACHFPPFTLLLFPSRPRYKRRAAFMMMLHPPTPISFLGIGLMGKPMAMNIIKKGYQVTVWNRTVSKADDLISAGARVRKSPADAVREAAAVILMLENGAMVTDVLFHQG